jgi:hypothetical protein
LDAFRRHRGDRESGALGRSLSRRAYGAYIVQPIVIVPLAVAASFALGARPGHPGRRRLCA